ncbi:MAG: glycosyltransferase 87 family protein, partial [Actinomycetota bacterium]|nr:glycosyltransferase 87 family protein [Actinomycetota bacterium]
LVAWARHRDGWAGILIGVGAAAKFYPALLVVPLFLQGLQDLEPDRSVRVLWWSAGSWAVINLPFALAAPGAWWEFFSFNGSRTPDFDSAWYIACRHLPDACLSISNVNLLALSAFLATSFVAIWWKARRDPSFPRWTIGVPLLICFLLTNKVYSPQYSLWLLPWFAMTMPNLRRFVAFETADLAVFVTRFWFFGSYSGFMVLPQQWWFEVALGVRAAVLVWCLIAWVRDDLPPLRLLRPAAETRPLPALVA